MRTIYKYSAKIETYIEIKANGFVRILKIGIQNSGELTIWCEVAMDTINEATTLRFKVVGTGCPLENHGAYVDTVFDGPFVWHVFMVE